MTKKIQKMMKKINPYKYRINNLLPIFKKFT